MGFQFSQHVFENTFNETSFHWSGEQIGRIEALDQMNGVGGQVWDVCGGIHFNFVDITFKTWLAAEARIDFVVNIYGSDFVSSNDIVVGELTNRSHLLHT